MGAVDRLADLGDSARDPGRGLVVDDADRLQPMLAISSRLIGTRRSSPIGTKFASFAL